MIPTLETDRLILREPPSEDFPVYEAFFDDAVASAAYGGPLSSGQAWRVLATDLGHWALRGYGRWAVTVKQLGWPLVETHMNDENEPARRLVEALGGKVIGRGAFPDGLTRNIYGLPEPV